MLGWAIYASTRESNGNNKFDDDIKCHAISLQASWLKYKYKLHMFIFLSLLCTINKAPSFRSLFLSHNNACNNRICEGIIL